MNKKIIGGLLIAFMAFTTYLAYRSLDGIKDFDLNDPFEVELDE